MDQFDVVVIGAGLGGLTAGAKLSLGNKKVLLIEQHSIPGGCATTFMRKGCKFEVGLHELDGLDPEDMKYPIFKDLKITENINLVKLPDFFRYVVGDFSFVMPHNADQAIERLSEIFPDERKSIIKFFKTIARIRKDVNKFCTLSPFKRIMLMPVAPFIFPGLIFNLNKNLGDFLDQCFKSDKLKSILNANMLYYTTDPYNLSLLFYSTGNASYMKGGTFIEGGSQELSNYLAGLITKNNGQILYKCNVDKIIVENGKAIGVEYSKTGDTSGVRNKVFGKEIVANTAIPNVANDLLTKEESVKLRKKIKNFQNSLSVLTVYLLYDIPLSELGNNSFSICLENEKFSSLKDMKGLNDGDFQNRPLVFTDYSQIKSGLTPPDKAFAVIVCNDKIDEWDTLNPQDYKAKKDEVAKILIARIEKLIPGSTEHIIYSEVATAKTMKRYIQTPGGAIYGFSQKVSQSGLKRLSIRSFVKNLHFASAWTFPGGGFSCSITSGYNCAKAILRKR